MDYEIDFLKSLALTIFIESFVLITTVKMFFKKEKISIGILILTGIVASFATLPYLWFIIPLFIKQKIYYNLVSEITAFAIESFIIFGFLKIDLKRAFALSAICNLISYLVGLLLNSL